MAIVVCLRVQAPPNNYLSVISLTLGFTLGICRRLSRTHCGTSTGLVQARWEKE